MIRSLDDLKKKGKVNYLQVFYYFLFLIISK